MQKNLSRKLFVDLETYMIDMSQEWEKPKPVCISWCSDDQTEIGIQGSNDDSRHLEERIGAMLKDCAEGKYKLVWQNGFDFDLPVIWYHFPKLRHLLITCLDVGGMHDTLIREKLLDISTTGWIRPKGYSLSAMAKKYLNRDVTKYKEGGDIWRVRYGELDGVRADQYPKEAKEYCILDVKDLLRPIFNAQEKIRAERGPSSANTEDLQIRAGLVFALMYNRGLKIDIDALDKLELEIGSKLKPLQDKLVELGYATNKTTFKKLDKKFTQYLEENYPDYLVRTAPTKTFPDGKISIKDEDLEHFPPDEIINIRREMSLLEKYSNTYIKNIRRAGGVFHAPYDILKETGRASSNIHTMPREGNIRELFIPRDGHLFVAIDYRAIEACSIAQACYDEKLGNTLRDFLNSGDEPQDYHALLGHIWHAYRTSTKANLEDFKAQTKAGSKEHKISRTFAKPSGLSYFGGVGNRKTQIIARGQGIKLTLDDVMLQKQFYIEQVPEYLKVFGKEGWLDNHRVEKTGKRRKFTYFKDNGDEVEAEADEWYYGYETNGRYRARCTYCSCANGRYMQSLAADGAKEAIWECFKDGDDIVAFIHDEIIFEVPIEGAEQIAIRKSELMCKGMQRVLPDVRIAVEWGIMDRWSKDESKHLKRGVVWKDPMKIDTPSIMS